MKRIYDDNELANSIEQGADVFVNNVMAEVISRQSITEEELEGVLRTEMEAMKKNWKACVTKGGGK